MLLKIPMVRHFQVDSISLSLVPTSFYDLTPLDKRMSKSNIVQLIPGKSGFMWTIYINLADGKVVGWDTLVACAVQFNYKVRSHSLIVELIDSQEDESIVLSEQNFSIFFKAGTFDSTKQVLDFVIKSNGNIEGFLFNPLELDFTEAQYFSQPDHGYIEHSKIELVDSSDTPECIKVNKLENDLPEGSFIDPTRIQFTNTHPRNI